MALAKYCWFYPIPGSTRPIVGTTWQAISINQRLKLLLLRQFLALLTGTALILSASHQTIVGHQQSKAHSTPALLSTPEATAFYVDDLDPDQAIRGQAITATGTFPSDVTTMKIKFYRAENAYTREDDPKKREANGSIFAGQRIRAQTQGRAVTFELPVNAPLGKYDVLFEFPSSGQESTYVWMPLDEGYFKVAATEEHRIESVSPDVVYADAENKYTLKVFGQGFSPYLTDNLLYLNDTRIPNCTADVTEQCVTQSVGDDGREIEFKVPMQIFIDDTTISNRQRGVRVRIGADSYTNSMSVVFAKGQRWYSSFAGAGLSLVLLAVVLIVGWRRRWLIEESNNTLSLSVLQFILWTFTALFSLLYLFLAKSFVQGTPTFVDIPASFPFMIALPGAALAGGQLVNHITGPKGSNSATKAEWSDLVAAGGKFAPDRLQLLLLTILGVGFYLALVVMSDPGRINELPAIPPTFLALFGTSAAVYLGVKGVTTPGPTITSFKYAYDGPNDKEILQIYGRYLSPEATITLHWQETDKNKPPTNDPLVPGSYTIENKVPEKDHKELSTHLIITRGYITHTTPPQPMPIGITVRNQNGQQSVYPDSSIT